MLQETSPKAHELIAHMPPADYDRIGSAVLRLAHDSTFTQNRIADFPTYEQVPPSEHTPEQAQAHTKVGELMASVSGYLAVAHAELGASNAVDAGYEAADQKDTSIFTKAKETALTDAVKAHNQGESEVAETAIESMFALAMLEGSHTDSSREIRELVALGMADTVVSAGTKMHGVVALGRFEDPKPVWKEYGETTSLLQIVTEKTFDDQMQHVTSLRDAAESEKNAAVEQLQQQLAAEDNLALAKLELNVNRNPDSAMHNLVEAGEKFLKHGSSYTAPSDIADVVKLSNRCAKELQTTEAQTAYHEITGNLRARRRAGLSQRYRQNDPLNFELDAATVQLAAEGDVDGVMALISSSPQEETNLNWPMQWLRLSEQQAESISATVSKCSAEKRTELQARLAENGAPVALIEADIMASDDPDGMAQVSHDFWQQYSKGKNLQIDKLMFGPSAHNQVKRTENILDLMQAGVEYDKIETHMIPRMSRLPTEERAPYLASVTAFLENIKSSLPEGETDLPRDYLSRALEVYRPDEMLTYAQWLYGDNAIADMPNAINILTDHRVKADGMLPFDKKILSRIEAITGVEGEITASLNEKTRAQALTYALNEENPVEALQEIMKLRESVAFITNAPPRKYDEEEAKEYRLDIPFLAHPKAWMRLIDSLPEGKDGERMKKMIVDRLFLPQQMANLKEGAFIFYEHPVESIRMFTEIAPSPPESVKRLLYPLQVELLRMLAAADSSTAIHGADNKITGFRGFPSTRPTKVREVFFHDELAILYNELVEARKSGDDALQQYLEKHPGLRQEPTMNANLTEVLAQLRLSTAYYRREHLDAEVWIKQFAKEPIKTGKLLAAWESRGMALTYRDAENPDVRVADNPNDILNFMATHGLRLLMAAKTEAGEETITKNELEEFKPWIEAIGSRYAVRHTLSMLERVAAHRRANGVYPAKVLAPNTTNVTVTEESFEEQDDKTYQQIFKERKLVAEILAGDDPGGFTIGYDTGCCMRLGGAAEDCVWAGYEDPNYAFFTVRDEGNRLRAQSLLYVTEYMGKKYLVADNIETNGGTDVNAIGDAYKQALVEFIKRQNLDIDAIHVGIGFLQDAMLANVPVAAVAPPTPRAGIYTDATKQKVLWQKASE
jgi:hypothetical protein